MGSSPRPPDPYKTAQAQASANFTAAQQNAILGNVNEYTPYGSKTYQQIGWDPVYDSSGKMSYAPRYQSQVQLSPDQQRLLAQQTGLQYNLGNLGLSQSSRLQSLLGKEMNTAGLQGWRAAAAPGALRQDQGPTDRAAIERAMMASRQRAVAPQQRAEDVQLAARGLSPGGAGYGTVQAGREDAASEAARQAYLASGGEARAAQEAYNAVTQQRYQLGGDWAAQLNNLRQAQLAERTALRNQPINEIMALLGGSGVTTPQFQPFAGPNVAPAPIGQNIYDAYNAQAQQAAARNQGLFGLAGAGLQAAFMPFGGAGIAGKSLMGRMFG
jgi:hypothetical protein